MINLCYAVCSNLNRSLTNCEGTSLCQRLAISINSVIVSNTLNSNSRCIFCTVKSSINVVLITVSNNLVIYACFQDIRSFIYSLSNQQQSIVFNSTRLNLSTFVNEFLRQVKLVIYTYILIRIEVRIFLYKRNCNILVDKTWNNLEISSLCTSIVGSSSTFSIYCSSNDTQTNRCSVAKLIADTLNRSISSMPSNISSSLSICCNRIVKLCNYTIPINIIISNVLLGDRESLIQSRGCFIVTLTLNLNRSIIVFTRICRSCINIILPAISVICHINLIINIHSQSLISNSGISYCKIWCHSIAVIVGCSSNISDSYIRTKCLWIDSEIQCLETSIARICCSNNLNLGRSGYVGGCSNLNTISINIVNISKIEVGAFCQLVRIIIWIISTNTYDRLWRLLRTIISICVHSISYIGSSRNIERSCSKVSWQNVQVSIVSHVERYTVPLCIKVVAYNREIVLNRTSHIGHLCVSNKRDLQILNQIFLGCGHGCKLVCTLTNGNVAAEGEIFYCSRRYCSCRIIHINDIRRNGYTTICPTCQRQECH